VNKLILKKPRLSCDLHDYLEIACMYGYQVELKLESGLIVCGKPITTGINKQRLEYLLFEVDPSLKKEKLLLCDLSSMQVKTKHAKFKNISF